MKKTKYPNLRTHVRRGKNGQVWTYWGYDRRAEGLPELMLGYRVKPTPYNVQQNQQLRPIASASRVQAFLQRMNDGMATD